eukprot:6538705-Prymnesium_polylepis.1
MISYAREDSHYLLYIYDKLKGELAPRRLIMAVWQRSAELCKQAYKVAPLEADEHLHLVRRQNAQLTPTQLAVHRALFMWRDGIAREEDESPGCAAASCVRGRRPPARERVARGEFAACRRKCGTPRVGRCERGSDA